MIPFGEYLPDVPALENSGATVATNVVPRTAASYGPLAGLSAVADALPSRCQGAASLRDSSGNVYTVAGDAATLQRLSASTWADASRSGGYTTGADEHWEFAQYGQRVMATNKADPMQSYVMGSSTQFADLAAAAPRARHINVIREFILVGNTTDGTDGDVPNRIWWSAIDDPTNWPTPGTSNAAAVQSDRQDIPTGGWVQRIVGAVGGADGAVFMETAVYRVAYEGPPTVFGFYEIERARGTPAPNSVENVGPVTFYLGQDGFYAFNGAVSEPIGAYKVDRTFYADLDDDYLHRVYAASDPDNKLVYWAYPGSGNTNGNPNKLLVYNWALGRWSSGEVTCEFLFREFPQGYTLEQLDAFGTLETLPFSLDSRAWTGGRQRLAAFDASHRMSAFAGTNLAATVETGEFSDPSGRRVLITGIRPLVDGGSITATVRHRGGPGDSLVDSTAVGVDADGVCHPRLATRFARARIAVAAGGTWSHAQGIEALLQPEGKR